MASDISRILSEKPDDAVERRLGRGRRVRERLFAGLSLPGRSDLPEGPFAGGPAIAPMSKPRMHPTTDTACPLCRPGPALSWIWAPDNDPDSCRRLPRLGTGGFLLSSGSYQAQFACAACSIAARAASKHNRIEACGCDVRPPVSEPRARRTGPRDRTAVLQHRRQNWSRPRCRSDGAAADHVGAEDRGRRLAQGTGLDVLGEIGDPTARNAQVHLSRRSPSGEYLFAVLWRMSRPSRGYYPSSATGLALGYAWCGQVSALIALLAPCFALEGRAALQG